MQGQVTPNEFRTQLLNWAYGKTGGNATKYADVKEFHDTVGWTFQEAYGQLMYLKSKEMIDFTGDGLLRLLPAGIDAAESAAMNERERTPIPPANITVQGDYHAGDRYSVQQGFAGPNIVVSGNTIGFNQWQPSLGSLDAEAVNREITEIRHALRQRPESDQNDLAIGKLAEAKNAIGKNDIPAVLAALKTAGGPVLEVANEVGATNVLKLVDAATPSTDDLLERLKVLLRKADGDIELHDIISAQTDAVATALVDERLSVSDSASATVVRDRIQEYERIVGPFVDVLVTCCYWDEYRYSPMWAEALDVVANTSHRRGNSVNVMLLGLSKYPALVLLYGCGLAAVQAGRYKTLNDLLTKPEIHRNNWDDRSSPPAIAMTPHRVFERELANEILYPGRNQNYYVPVSEHMHEILRGPLRRYVRDDRKYDILFDKFEFLFSAVCAHLTDKEEVARFGGPTSDTRFWGPIGRFGWRSSNGPFSIVNELVKEASEQKSSWAPITAGMFDGSHERFLEIAEGIRAQIKRSNYF